METNGKSYDVVVIGSGFGGTMVALTLANAFKDTNKKILILERGTWWTTPVSTVADKSVATEQFLRDKKQPVQFWPSMDHFKGFLDILLRCVRHEGNEDGLYDFTAFGKKGLLGGFLGIGAESDGVMILRASGVGGGSLVYSNITIQPPDLVFEDARWPGWTKHKNERDKYFDLARQAIGYGVVYARELQKDPNADPKLRAYGGLHNVVARSARLDPHLEEVQEPSTGRRVKRLSTADSHPKSDPKNALWIDRARVFQTAAKAIASEFGTVDSSVNDLPLGTDAFEPGEKPGNYCERQGRCNVGCLPGARHTLNKQLMRAVFGTPDNPTPQFPNLTIEAMVDVDRIEASAHGGYEIHYRKRNPDKPEQTTAGKIKAGRVVVSAGCVGTTEIMLRSAKENGGSLNLSDRLGEGFSTNGDYLAFLEDIDEHVSLTRGPVTTSYAHFNTEGEERTKFHSLEDQGVPKALASIIGYGVPFLHAIADGLGPKSGRVLDILRLVEGTLVSEVGAYFQNARKRQPAFFSEDEKTATMMCVVGMGLDAANGKFTLGKNGGETALRLKRTDGKQFHEDSIYDEIRKSLGKLAGVLKKKGDRTFLNPFLTPTADALAAKSVVLTHPLGGCRMAPDAARGVVDEQGRAFDRSSGKVYPGLYIADASIVPTALGLNPSLTISALSLRVADTIVQEIKNEGA